jgi:hypothetical protein
MTPLWKTALFLCAGSFFLPHSLLAKNIEVTIDQEKISLPADDRPWTLGFENKSGDRGVFQYMLPGEKAEDWSEAITVNYFKGMEGSDLLERFVGFTKGGLSVRCEKFKWKDLAKSENSILYEWSAQSCQGAPDQSEIALAVKSGALYVFHYANKKVPMPEEQHTFWENALTHTQITQKIKNKK